MRLDILTTGLAGGLTAAIFNLILGLIAMTGLLPNLNYITQYINISQDEATSIGVLTIIGMVVGAFITFFILGAIFASVYNSLSRRVQVTHA